LVQPAQRRAGAAPGALGWSGRKRGRRDGCNDAVAAAAAAAARLPSSDACAAPPPSASPALPPPPQTEAELAQLELGDIERLAEEAAEWQERAGAALRLARQRLHAGGRAEQPDGGRSAGQPGNAAIATASSLNASPAEGAAQATAEPQRTTEPELTATAAPAAAPAPLLLALQLLLLLAAAAEVALLWGVGLAGRASGGVVRLPRSLVLAPVSAARGGVMAALLAADLALALGAALVRVCKEGA
jgi:hypothetical protein